MPRPIVLAEFNVAAFRTDWVAVGGGVWAIDVSGAYPDVDPELVVDVRIDAIDRVGSVMYEGELLAEVFAYADLQDAPSFYWDAAIKTVYARFPDWNWPNDTVRMGGRYFISTDYFENGGTTYDDRLVSVPPMEQKKDRLFFNKLVTANWSMNIANADLFYDDLHKWGAYNQQVRYFLVPDADAVTPSIVPIRVGRIKDFAFKGNEVEVFVQDIRAALSAQIPATILTKTAYPDLATDLVGQLVPIAFGKLYDVVPVCVNSLNAAGPYTFLLADATLGALKEITTVRVDGAVVTPNSTNLTTCSFTLTAAQVKNGTVFKNVSVDFQGYAVATVLVNNPLDIVSKLIETYADIVYGADTYDTAEWTAEKATKPAVALYVKDAATLLSAIEQIMFAVRGGFLVKPDGKFTWRTSDLTGAEDWTITDDDWLDTPEIVYDTSEMLSFARAGYARKVNANVLTYAQDDSHKAYVRNLYGTADGETFDTALVEAADALAYAQRIMDESADPTILVYGRLSGDFAEMEIGQTVLAAINRLSNNVYVPWLGTLKGEAIRVAPDPMTGEVEVTLRFIGG
jgi:hypothetical protein